MDAAGPVPFYHSRRPGSGGIDAAQSGTLSVAVHPFRPPTIASSTPAMPSHGPLGLSIRQDAPPRHLAELDARCFGESWRAGEYASLLENERVHGWVLIHEASGAVGLLCFQDAGGEVEIYKIGIVPEARGRGWGRWLLEALMAGGPVQGWKAIYLEVRESNLAGRRLYESCGFQHTGFRNFYYRDPMEKALSFTYRYPESATPKG